MKRLRLIAAGLFVLAGCGRDGSPAGRAGLPSSGRVKIVPSRVKEDATHFIWLWTIEGERNWITPTMTGNDFHLTGTYPMNGKDSGGTHVWEFWVTIEKPENSKTAAYLMNLKLRGSNAAMTGSTSAIDTGPDGSLSTITRAVQTSETTVSLPAKITLATINRKNITLTIDP